MAPLIATMVMVEYIFKQAFQLNKGGLASAASVIFFPLISSFRAAISALRARGEKMSAATEAQSFAAPSGARQLARLRHFDAVGLVITLATCLARPLGLSALLGNHYHLQARVRDRAPGRAALARTLHVRELRARSAADQDRPLVRKLADHLGGGHLLVLIMAAGAGYAISQLNFPGRRLFWWIFWRVSWSRFRR